MEVITKSARETQNLGEEIGHKLKPKKIIALYGDLGSGKTTFLQGLAKGLGVKRRVISPTFVFVKEYPIFKKENLTANFYHIDLYRIEKLKEALHLGLEEMLADKKAIVVVEWAEKIKKMLPKKRIDIFFSYLRSNKRKIIIREK